MNSVINQAKFVAGNLPNFLSNWEEITCDSWILDCISGVKLPFIAQPKQLSPPRPYRLKVEERPIMSMEIEKLLLKGVIEEAVHEEGEWLSNVFLRPKPNGQFRLILDMTEINKLLEYKHFKMFSLGTASDLITHNSWMASIDLRDAYYTVAICDNDKKYLRFKWNDKLYQYNVMPNGLAPAPRYFTKMLKPVFATLSSRGHCLFPYIDDSFIISDNFEDCLRAVNELKDLLQYLGFWIHEEKSVFTPTKNLKFLGLMLDSNKMQISLTEDKRIKFKRIAEEVMSTHNKVKIRAVASLVGLMVAYSPGLEYAGAHIKGLEGEKNLALKRTRGNFEKDRKSVV